MKKPLLGLPVTVKESYNVAGLPTTWGIPAQKDFTPTEDALPISRVKDAGGVILGKTNVPLGLGDWQSYNEIYGTTNNPVRSRPHAGRLLRRIVGGARGGLWTAVARLRYRRLAARAGVSLRRLCAQADLRPRRHARPHAAALAAAAVRRATSAVIGPMARGAADLSLLLDVIAGPDPLEAGKAYQPRAAAAASHGAEEFSRAADRYRSGHADRQRGARHARNARRQSRQGRRQGRPHQSAAARLRRVNAGSICGC